MRPLGIRQRHSDSSGQKSILGPAQFNKDFGPAGEKGIRRAETQSRRSPQLYHSVNQKGRDAKAPLISIVEAHLNQVLLGMSQKEYDAGMHFLRRVINNLSHVKNGG